MASGLGVKEEDVVARVAEMRTELKARSTALLNQKILKELGPALADLQELVVMHMGATDGLLDDDSKLKVAVQTALDKPEVKRLAEMVVKAKGGPALALGTAGQQGTFDADKVGYEEANKTGMLRQ